MDVGLGYNEEEIKMVKETKKIWKVGGRGTFLETRSAADGRPAGRFWGPAPAAAAGGPGGARRRARPGVISHPLNPPTPNPTHPHPLTHTTPTLNAHAPWQDDTVKITATCVRVPVMRAHAESINLEFERPVTEAAAKAALAKAEGVAIIDDRANNRWGRGAFGGLLGGSGEGALWVGSGGLGRRGVGCLFGGSGPLPT
jgi:hypothetical protein